MRLPKRPTIPGPLAPMSRFTRVGEAEARLSRVSLRSQRASALTDRLEEALVFIIHADGHREYETMTLRQLYNYVLQAISKRPEGYVECSRNLMHVRSNAPHGTHEPPVHEDSNRDIPVAQESENGTEEDSDIEHKSREKGDTSDPRESQAKKVTFDGPEKPRHTRSPSISGTPYATEKVTYRERLGGYLHPRDMRRLVTPFSTTNAPELMVRRHVILLNCDPLRAIVLRDRLLVLVPDGADSILEMLGKRIVGGREEMEDSVFGTRHGELTLDTSHKSSSVHRKNKKFSDWVGHGKGKDTKRSESGVSDATPEEETDQTDEESTADEWDDLQGRGWIDMPFELKAVDAVLHTVSVMLSEDVATLQDAVYETIEEVVVRGRANVGDRSQQLLRAYKNEIKEMSSRVENFVRAINESLDDLEDLSLMNLSRLLTHPERFIQPVPEDILNEESDEPELILEVYLQQALSISNQLDLLQGQVSSSEELMAMQLDTVRNRLLYINAVVSVFTLSVSIAAVGWKYLWNECD